MKRSSTFFASTFILLMIPAFLLSPENSSGAEKVQLTMWAMPIAGPKTEELLQKEAAEFQKLHPDTEIKIVLTDWLSAWDKISACVELGQGPDIVQLGSTWVSAIASMDGLADLTGWFGETGREKEYSPAALSSCRIEGRTEVWAMPWFVETTMLFYRKDIFEKLGMSQKDLDDWNSFEKSCDVIKKAGLRENGAVMDAMGFPGKKDWVLLHNFAPWIWAAGGDFLTKDFKKADFNSQKAMEGISFITALAEKEYIPRRALSQSGIEVDKDFSDSRYAMIFGGPMTVMYLKSVPTEAGKNFAVTPLPKGPAGRFAFFGGSNLAIFRFSKHPDRAWEFINFLSSYESQTRLLMGTGLLPALKRALDDPHISLDENYKLFRDNYSCGHSYPSIPAWGVIESILTRHLSLIWYHVQGIYGPYRRESLKEEMDIAARKVNEVLSEMDNSHGE
jgi:multiple sugar transport system substrate-binding protein